MALEQAIDEERLIEAWIEDNPHKRPVADAWLKDYGVAVWAIMTDLKRGEPIEEVADAFDVPIEAIVAARAFYERNRGPIDARIAMNAG
jgi:uncharacterized protein (DUF433 family)